MSAFRWPRHPASLHHTLPLTWPLPAHCVAGDLLVTAGGAKRPKLIVLASEIGRTVTGSTKLAIAVSVNNIICELDEGMRGLTKEGSRSWAGTCVSDGWPCSLPSNWQLLTPRSCPSPCLCSGPIRVTAAA